MNQDQDFKPHAGEIKQVPTWIKVMWVCGIVFVILYVYNGLRALN
jgi:hypothetical protein